MPVLDKQLQFDLGDALDDVGPRFSIAPSQEVLAARQRTRETGPQPQADQRAFDGPVPSIT
jgi:hypothetical protein